MNGEADNSRFVNMHVYMHLAFKELISLSVLSGAKNGLVQACT